MEEAEQAVPSKKRKRLSSTSFNAPRAGIFFQERDWQSFSLFHYGDRREASKNITPKRVTNPTQSATTAVVVPAQPIQQTSRSEIDLGRYSSLSSQEHQHYLELEKRLRAGTLDPTQKAVFSKLQQRVIIEQEQYRSALRNYALSNVTLYQKYHPAIKAHIEQILTKKRSRACQYPRYWHPYERVEFNSVRIAQGDPVLAHRATLLEEGRVLLFQLPKLGSELPLDRGCYDLGKQVGGSHTPVRWLKKMIMPTVSQDSRATRLAEDHGVDIVTSSSALSRLIDNFSPNFSSQWEIPVVISTSPSPSTGQEKPRTIVYLDKPLLPKKMNLREKNEQFARTAFESLCADMSPSTSIRFGHTSSNDPLPECLQDDNVTYNLWAFGDLKVLVRCKIHGYLPDTSTPRGMRYVGVAAKMEYLPDAGPEEVTVSETSRMWIKTFIRPDAHMLLCRVDAQSTRIQQIQQLDMRAILFPGCSFNPLWPSKMIFTLFQKLGTLSAGNYLLSHRAGDGHITIYHAPSAEDRSLGQQDGILDLHTAHASSGATNKDIIPYIPPIWLNSSPDRIPYTFPPAPPLAVSSRHAKRLKNIKYCYSYAEMGTCKKGSSCGYPHLDMATVQQIAQEGKQKKNKKKRETKGGSLVAETAADQAEGSIPDDVLYIMQEHV